MKTKQILSLSVTGMMMVGAQAFARSYCPNGYIHNTSSGLCVTSACSGKCTYTYDPVSHDFWAEKKPDVPDETPVLLSDVRLSYNDGTNGILKNASIGEGITGFQNRSYVFFNHPSDPIGKGTLKLPSTFGGDLNFSNIHTGNFATYDLSDMKNAKLLIGSSSSYNIIMDDDSNLDIRRYCNYGNCASSVNIICKGYQTACSKQLKGIWGADSNNNFIATQITTSYYSGLDEDGNWEVWSDEGKAIYADSSMQKTLSKYDFDGNQTGLYEYDRGGNLVKAIENGNVLYRRRIYTPAEATAAVSGKNTFKIQYQ